MVLWFLCLGPYLGLSQTSNMIFTLFCKVVSKKSSVTDYLMSVFAHHVHFQRVNRTRVKTLSSRF